MLELSFSRNSDKKFPLKATFEYEEGQDDDKSESMVYFWANIKLDTEDELRQFTECKWKAMIISSGVVFNRFTLLVVKKVGKVYERIGIAHGSYGSAELKNMRYRTIKLQ